jgi:hypothetical protein
LDSSISPHLKVPPKDDELEISLLGPGYGESVVIHLGNDNWIIVDSCRLKGIEDPAPLHYLKQIDRDISSCVKLVVATHWDDDHIGKLHKVIENCLSAEFFISQALNNEKFTTLVIDSPLSSSSAQKTPSGLSEFSKIFSILFERQKQIKYSSNDKLLWRSKINSEDEIWALSPSDKVFEQSIASLIAQIPDKNSSNGKIRTPSPNLTSVALWIKLGGTKVLLGADLEEDSTHKGWSIIMDDCKCIDGKASIFKVPHHGSENGDHPRVWEELLQNDPICLVAPWNKSSKLPTQKDIQRLKQNSNHLYLTADPYKSEKFKVGDGFLRRKFKEKKIREVLTNFGMVRLRKAKDSDEWERECFGQAQLVS